MPKLTRYVSRLHKVLGLVIGAQLLLWTLSGLFFALRPIEEVRGEHLRVPALTELPSAQTGGAPLIASDPHWRAGGPCLPGWSPGPARLRPFSLVSSFAVAAAGVKPCH